MPHCLPPQAPLAATRLTAAMSAETAETADVVAVAGARIASRSPLIERTMALTIHTAACAAEGFGYRSIEPVLTVFDWSVTDDLRRALEFLKLTVVSRGGLTPAGSGTVSMMTPPLFCIRARGARDRRRRRAGGNGGTERGTHVHGEPRPGQCAAAVPPGQHDGRDRGARASA